MGLERQRKKDPSRDARGAHAAQVSESVQRFEVFEIASAACSRPLIGGPAGKHVRGSASRNFFSLAKTRTSSGISIMIGIITGTSMLTGMQKSQCLTADCSSFLTVVTATPRNESMASAII